MTLVLLSGLLAAGAVGAVLARWARVPLWPMTGAIVGSALFAWVTDGAAPVPGWWSPLAQILVGCSVGSRLGPQVLTEFRAVLLPGTVAVLSIVVAGIGIGFAFAGLGMLSPVVAVFGSVPGGVGEMVAAATTLGGDSAVVAGMHLVRLLVLITALPVMVAWLRRGGEPESSADAG
jgi:membrane AbrB-like protein